MLLQPQHLQQSERHADHARHLLHYVRRSAAAPEAATDGQLLQRFLDRRDDEAFAALVAAAPIIALAWRLWS